MTGPSVGGLGSTPQCPPQVDSVFLRKLFDWFYSLVGLLEKYRVSLFSILRDSSQLPHPLPHM